jgi:DNA-binding transcriptional LysR family regulator
LTANLFDVIANVEFRDVEVTLAVAEAGSFWKASSLLCLGQYAVTRRLQKLEDEIGVSLLERCRSSAKLTRAGWSFAERARAIANELQSAFEAAPSAGLGGKRELRLVLIASMSRCALREVVAEFSSKHPCVEIHFVESERSNGGRIVEQGPPRSMFKSPREERTRDFPPAVLRS